MTIAAALFPVTRDNSLARRLTIETLLILGGSLVVALSAYIRIDLPFSPIPITGQVFGGLVTGAALGARRGFLSLAAYVAEGAMGFPVFAGGTCCLAVLLGPTGGYLLSYPLAAGVTGWLAERGWDRKWHTTALAMLAGNIVIYLMALPWLALFVGSRVFAAGLIPFIGSDILQLIFATIALPLAWKVVGRLHDIQR